MGSGAGKMKAGGVELILLLISLCLIIIIVFKHLHCTIN